jgi:hypothetical protein
MTCVSAGVILAKCDGHWGWNSQPGAKDFHSDRIRLFPYKAVNLNHQTPKEGLLY